MFHNHAVALLCKNLLFGLKNSLMQDLKEVFTSLEYILVDLLSLGSWHSLVPQIDDDQDVLDAHLL